ncbi:MAG: adenylate kinase [Chlamydiales bacterium]|nr:adenylate kinase [Chlamydiales bacterium]
MAKPETKKNVIVMLGAPGAGKGTQAIQTSEKFNLPHISTGDLFRENLKNHTEIGEKARSYMDSGRLVPDEVVLEMLYQRIKKPDCDRGYILDGCPRTVAQAESLDRELKDSRVMALNLDVPDEEIVRRIADRMVCEVCGMPHDPVINPPKVAGHCNRDGGTLIKRKDDTPEVVRERLSVYHNETAPVKAYYKKSSRLVDIDGTVGKDAIFLSIQSTLSKVL